MSISKLSKSGGEPGFVALVENLGILTDKEMKLLFSLFDMEKILDQLSNREKLSLLVYIYVKQLEGHETFAKLIPTCQSDALVLLMDNLPEELCQPRVTELLLVQIAYSMVDQ